MTPARMVARRSVSEAASMTSIIAVGDAKTKEHNQVLGCLPASLGAGFRLLPGVGHADDRAGAARGVGAREGAPGTVRRAEAKSGGLLGGHVLLDVGDAAERGRVLAVDLLEVVGADGRDALTGLDAVGAVVGGEGTEEEEREHRQEGNRIRLEAREATARSGSAVGAVGHG